MNREQLDKAKEILKELKSSEGSNSLMKRAAMVAVVLGFIRSTAGLAGDGDVSKLVNALGPQTDRTTTIHPWQNWTDWNDWKDWKDWSDWNDWNNWTDWNDWKDWANWNDWKDWKNWNDWKDWNNWQDWRDWGDVFPI
jgi:hypothetical protein